MIAKVPRKHSKNVFPLRMGNAKKPSLIIIRKKTQTFILIITLLAKKVVLTKIMRHFKTIKIVDLNAYKR